MSEKKTEETPPKGLPQTDWSEIGRLGKASENEHRVIIGSIAGKYWSPIYQYLRFRGYDHYKTQDLIQDFFVFAMQTHLFEKADKSRGRFRSFLLGSLNNFVANHHRSEHALKREPTEGIVSLDEPKESERFLSVDLRDDASPDVIFNKAWVREVVRNVLEDMERNLNATGKATHYKLFKIRFVNNFIDGDEPPPLKQLASELGLEYKEAANQLLTARRIFMRMIEKEVRTYVCSDEEAVEEIEDVMQAFEHRAR